VVIAGRDVTALKPQKRDVGMVFQNYALFPHMDVWDNVEFGLRSRGVPRDQAKPKVERALALVEMEGYGKRKVQALSGGQQQRVALARALAPEPPLLLLDEPLSNLDAALRERTRDELRALLKRLGMTAVFVTHDQEEAFALSDRIAVMSRGVLQQIGTPEELYTQPANTFVARFIGSPAMNLVPSGTLGVGGAGQLAGFRPEHVELGNGRAGSASYDASIEVVEYLGDEQLAHVRLGDHDVVVKLPVEPRLQAGRQETFSVPLQKVLLFDDTGARVGSPA
jgi:sn-glycerol 3-phosphate transport system ATP-binding protein/multiple sugar transport system ATP-binding protein